MLKERRKTTSRETRPACPLAYVVPTSEMHLKMMQFVKGTSTGSVVIIIISQRLGFFSAHLKYILMVSHA